jgi:hypothetical protein
MTKAQEYYQKISQIKRELQSIEKQKFDMEMRCGKLKEELWRWEGRLEEETDEHEYRNM